MKKIPDFDVELAQCIDFIFESPLTKRALIKPPFDSFTNIIIDVIKSIDRLADNCHMPEFTNHAMPHICSIVKRASEWGEHDGWIKKISSQEAAYLLLALLIHDIGMLSQDVKNIPVKEQSKYLKGSADIANWVRRTHVIRIESLVKQLLKKYIKKDRKLKKHLNVIISMAGSHDKWPWQDGFVSDKKSIKKLGLEKKRIKSLNAIIAISDLLDEDSNRCDTLTLIEHHQGTIENMAHWIRHALTKEVSSVKNHEIHVEFRGMKHTNAEFELVYCALRNHYRLVKLYNKELSVLDAEITHISFDPNDGVSEYYDEISERLKIYKKIPELKNDLVPYLISTFMEEALNREECDMLLRQKLDEIGLECVEVLPIKCFMESEELVCSEERVVFGKEEALKKLNYIKDLADDSYANGKIARLRYLCRMALILIKDSSIKDIYWAYTYLLICENSDMNYYDVSNNYPKTNRSANLSVSVCRDNTYNVLLDILVCFLEPNISQEYIEKHKKNIYEMDYQFLQEDLATELLCLTIIGLFWFWDRTGESWLDISDYMCEHIKIQSLGQKIGDLRERLLLQFNILENNHCVSEEMLNNADMPVFARAWTYFYRADWKNVMEIYPELIRMGEKNRELFCAIQGFQNMTRPVLEWNGFLEREMETYSLGIYRYQRATEEQGFPRFWQSREVKIKSLLAEMRLGGKNNENRRQQTLRMISLQYIEGLRTWNLGEYLEAVRNYVFWLYSVATYKDQKGRYCGYKMDLPETVILCIQSMQNQCFTKKEKLLLISTMKKEYLCGFSEIAKFIVNNECKCTWKYAIEWVEEIITELEQSDRKDILAWLILYDEYRRTRKDYLNLGEFEFLVKVVEKFSEEEWDIIFPVIERIYNNSHLYQCNEKLRKKALRYMPIEKCKNQLRKIVEWNEDENLKSMYIYELCIYLHEAKRNGLDDFLKNMVHDCKMMNPEISCYDELEKLMHITVLSERKSIDFDGIEQCIDNMLHELRGLNNLLGYDSEIMKQSLMKSTNQNWKLADEEKVLQLLSRLESFLLEVEGSISGVYFRNFCSLFSEIARTGSEKEARKILTFFIDNCVKRRFSLENKKMESWGGPLNAFHLDFGSATQIEYGVAQVLVSAVSQIPEVDYSRCSMWLQSFLPKDQGKVCYAFIVLNSYFYFMSNEIEVKMLALSALTYVRGMLEIEEQYSENRKNIAEVALENLKNVDQWFGDKSFENLAIQDEKYRKLFYDYVMG